MVPTRAYAITRGGEARKFIFTSGWIRPSKLRLPLNTDATTKSF
jgi:hypothetical protein